MASLRIGRALYLAWFSSLKIFSQVGTYLPYSQLSQPSWGDLGTSRAEGKPSGTATSTSRAWRISKITRASRTAPCRALVRTALNICCFSWTHQTRARRRTYPSSRNCARRLCLLCSVLRPTTYGRETSFRWLYAMINVRAPSDSRSSSMRSPHRANRKQQN